MTRPPIVVLHPAIPDFMATRKRLEAAGYVTILALPGMVAFYPDESVSLEPLAAPADTEAALARMGL